MILKIFFRKSKIYIINSKIYIEIHLVVLYNILHKSHIFRRDINRNLQRISKRKSDQPFNAIEKGIPFIKNNHVGEFTMKQHLLPREGNFYKACLHVHTTCSDGLGTPEEIKVDAQ